ncbi:hypothetical protein HanRHA438_Chr08g0338611 [Helianthus annuus]|nr:hypothetical protein HanRHA438_Chr08g0338581 [Helianthus annuus]KAJ0896799.1 hypothetical protein HanRHA438_Chr08g0338611 [Helianthus annuus]
MYIDTNLHKDDVLTKSLSKIKLMEFRSSLGTKNIGIERECEKRNNTNVKDQNG